MKNSTTRIAAILGMSLMLALSALLRSAAQLGREWDWADLQRALDVRALLDGAAPAGAAVHNSMLSQGPLFSLLLAPFSLASGGVFGPFLGMNALALLAILLGFALARRHLGAAPAWLAAALLALSPWGVALGADVSNNEAGVAFAVLAGLAALEFSRKPTWQSWALFLLGLSLAWQVALSNMLAVLGMLAGLLFVRRAAVLKPGRLLGLVAVFAANIMLTASWPASGATGWAFHVQNPLANLSALTRGSAGMVLLGLVMGLWAVWSGRPRQGKQDPVLPVLGLWVLVPIAYVTLFEPPERIHYLFVSLLPALMLLALPLSAAWLPAPPQQRGVSLALRGTQAIGLALLTAANLINPAIAAGLGRGPAMADSLLERQALFSAIERNLGVSALERIEGPDTLRGWGSYNQARFLARSLPLWPGPLALEAPEPCALQLAQREPGQALLWECPEGLLGPLLYDAQQGLALKLPASVELNPCVKLGVAGLGGTILELVAPATEAQDIEVQLDGNKLTLEQYESDEEFSQLYAELRFSDDAAALSVCTSAGRTLRVRLDVFAQR